VQWECFPVCSSLGRVGQLCMCIGWPNLWWGVTHMTETYGGPAPVGRHTLVGGDIIIHAILILLYSGEWHACMHACKRVIN
jgi:hypothetical protein